MNERFAHVEYRQRKLSSGEIVWDRVNPHRFEVRCKSCLKEWHMFADCPEGCSYLMWEEVDRILTREGWRVQPDICPDCVEKVETQGR